MRNDSLPTRSDARRVRVIRRISLGAAFLTLIGFCGFVVTPALAATPTFTWTGADAATSRLWSDGANWVGGVAPPSPGPVNLVFSGCATAGNCGSDNDLTGLTVANLTISGTNFNIDGNPITLDNLTATSGLSIAPLQIGATSQTWSLSGAAASVLSEPGRGGVGSARHPRSALKQHDLWTSSNFETTGPVAIVGANPSLNARRAMGPSPVWAGPR